MADAATATPRFLARYHASPLAAFASQFASRRQLRFAIFTFSPFLRFAAAIRR